MAKNYPDPVNQFNRLVYSSGTVPTGTYRLGSRWNNVRNGQNWDGRNCTAAIGAVMIDAHTGGKIKSSPPQIRNAQYDWSGGIGWDDVRVAWSRLWPSQSFILPSAHNWADVIASLKEGRFVGIQGDNDRMGIYSCQSGFTGDHAYGLGGWRASDSRVLKYDPLCHHASWVPQAQIRAAAEKLSMVQRGTTQRLFVALTKVMPQLAVSGVTLRYGALPVGAGRYLARRDNVPVRSGPGTNYPKMSELDYRESFAARQAKRVGGRWYGNAAGTRWIYESVLWYSGPIVGNETIA